MRARSAGPLSIAAALGAALLLAASAARAQTPQEPPLVVGSIRWTGVHATTSAALAERLFTKARPWWRLWGERPPFDEPTLEGDMQRIAAAYRELGYYRASARYVLTRDPAGREVRIQIDVEEGAPVRVASASVDLSEMPEGEMPWRTLLVDPLPLRPGTVFSVDAYGGAKRALLTGLANFGFPDATLSGGAEVDLASDTAVIAWAVHPGPRVFVGEIRIEGMQSVSDAVIRRELSFETGDVYSEADVQKSQRQVSDLGLFRSVQIRLEPGAGEAPPGAPPPARVTRAVTVRVEERPLRSVRLGVGYGTEDRVRAQAGWLHRNVSGRADSLDARVRYSSLSTEFQATLREPHVPDPRTTLWLDSRIREDTVPAYEDVGLLSRISIERPLRRGWSGHIGYDLEWTDVRSVPSVAATELADPVEKFLLSYFDIGVRRITTDSLVEPTRGTWLEASLEPAANWIGSQRSYLRWTLDGRAYFSLGPTVLAGRAMLGTISGFGGTNADELPVTKLFYAGGSGTVRGFDFQHLGPADALGTAVGGQSLLTASVEWRFPIWEELHGATFADAGQLSRRDWDWKPQELQYSVGAGLRYATPLGPVRVDVATPLDPPGGVDRVRIWFAIGQSF